MERFTSYIERDDIIEGISIGNVNAYTVAFMISDPSNKKTKTSLSGDTIIAAKTVEEAKRKIEAFYKKQFPGMKINIKGVRGAVKTVRGSG